MLSKLHILQCELYYFIDNWAVVVVVLYMEKKAASRPNQLKHQMKFIFRDKLEWEIFLIIIMSKETLNIWTTSSHALTHDLVCLYYQKRSEE